MTTNNHHKKKIKITQLIPMSFGMLNTRLGKPEPVSVKILWDSRASSTLVAEPLCSKLRVKKDTTTAWKTMAGTLQTNKTAKIQFALPEFNDTAVIEHKAHVAKDLGRYDIIVGGDLMKKLGIDLKYSTMTMSWIPTEIPMKPIDATPNVLAIDDSKPVKKATSRLTAILDAKYEAADLPSLVSNIEHLTEQEKQPLLSLLQ